MLDPKLHIGQSRKLKMLQDLTVKKLIGIGCEQEDLFELSNQKETNSKLEKKNRNTYYQQLITT